MVSERGRIRDALSEGLVDLEACLVFFWMTFQRSDMARIFRARWIFTFPHHAGVGKFKRCVPMLLLLWCLLCEINLAGSSLDNDVQYKIEDESNPRIIFHIPSKEKQRNMKNLRIASAHRRTRDTWRASPHDDVASSNSAKASYSRKGPWSSLYSPDLLTSHINAHGSHPPFARDATQNFKSLPAKRIAPPASQMLTVVKTYGPPSLQEVEPKDFYKSVYGTEEGLKSLKTVNGPANLTQAKINRGVNDELEDVRLANEHFIKMRKHGRCHLPAPEIVCVKDFYPSDSKEYLPRCTMLHRCGDKAGCCDSEGFKCVAKAIREISLNFYTILTSSRTSEASVASSVEKLLFENHTECECMAVDKDTNQTVDLLSSTTAVSIASSVTTAEPPLDQRPQKDHHKYASHHQRCRECPEPFCHRDYEDGRCSCDCFDKQKPCLKIKRGREPLTEQERRCVETGRCHIPDCEFGRYDYSTGRCPKRPDHMQKGSKNDPSKNFHHENHRWNSWERD